MSPLGTLIEIIARALADRPAEVQVREVPGERLTIIELRVAKPDLGKVIGKQGRTAHAMRVLLGAVASRDGKRVVLEILDP